MMDIEVGKLYKKPHGAYHDQHIVVVTGLHADAVFFNYIIMPDETFVASLCKVKEMWISVDLDVDG